MNSNSTIRADLNEILFDNRNKAYGAYQIRKEYPRTIMNAFYITTSVALTLVLLFYFLRDRPGMVDDMQKGIVTLTEVTIDRPLPTPPEPKAKKAAPLAAKKQKAAPKPKAKGMDTQKSANINPTPDADPDATIAPDSAYKDKQPGLTTTDSSSSNSLGGDPNGTGDPTDVDPCPDCPKEGDGDGTGEDDPDPFVPFLGEMPIPHNLNDIRKKIGYPRDAVETRLEGKVTYRVLVDENGDYLRHIVLRASHPIFDKACAKHLEDLSFTPGKMGDRAVKCWVVVPFKFKLMR
jgi:protein TonB